MVEAWLCDKESQAPCYLRRARQDGRDKSWKVRAALSILNRTRCNQTSLPCSPNAMLTGFISTALPRMRINAPCLQGLVNVQLYTASATDGCTGSSYVRRCATCQKGQPLDRVVRHWHPARHGLCCTVAAHCYDIHGACHRLILHTKPLKYT